MIKLPYKRVTFTVLISCLLNTVIFAKSFQTGDIIFHTSKSSQSIVIQKATASPYSHMGMIVYRNGKPWVLEAIQPVKYMPFDAWTKRGVNQHYVVKRYHKNLNAEQQVRLVKSAEMHLGKIMICILGGVMMQFIVLRLYGKLMIKHLEFSLHHYKNSDNLN